MPKSKSQLVRWEGNPQRAVGKLVSASNVNGPYTPVSSATSPYVVTPSATMFYRLQQ